MKRIWLAGACWLALCPLASPAARAQERCGTCHPQSRVAFERSIHAREDVGCVSCHGGDPAALEVEAAHRGGFRALDNRLESPAACAECHADLERMRAYGLPIDQYALYQTSAHGRALARGDRRAAVCTDCHGAHDVRAPEDPASPTHPRRIATTCERCHADPELAARYGMDSGVVADYRASVHGRALLEADVGAAPDCTSCHGAHGAAPPGIGSLDKVCGSCHAQARRAFVAGPHHEAMLAAGLPECASCHSNHAIRPLEPAAIEGMCEDCHDRDSDEARLGRLLHTSIAAAGEEVVQAEELVQRAARMAIDVDDHLARLEEARSYLTEVQPLVHAVSREPVEALTRRARSIGEEVEHELYEQLDRRPQRLGLVLLWFYVVMTLAILVGYKRRLLRGSETS